MRSIQSRLVALLLVGLGLLCLLGGGLAYWALRSALIAEFDYSLATKAHDFSIMTEQDQNRYEFEFQEKRMPEFERADHPEYFQVMHPDGGLIVRSPSLGIFRLVAPAEPLPQTPLLYPLELPGGRPGRAAALAVIPDGASDHILVLVARDTLRLRRVLTLLAAGFGSGTALLLLLIAVAVPRMVRRGLRPLEQLASQAESIKADALDTRFPETALPMELLPISRQLNRLLDRIESAFLRERRLGAAMAHELYTPIAELRSLAEVALKWPDDAESAAAMAGQSHGIALQMQSVVDALMAIARCEAGLYQAVREPVELTRLLADCRQQIDTALSKKHIAVSWAIPAALLVITDRQLLTAILTNLFGNAAEYTPEDGTFLCRAEEQGSHVMLVLENTRQGLETADLPHLFEPMWRKDKARTGSAHSGLGLTVAARFSALLGIGIEADLPDPGRFRITVRIPSHAEA